MSKKPFFNLILNQNVGFDVLAALSKGLTRAGVKHRFVYPHPKGALQGSSLEAKKFLVNYGLNPKLLYDLRWRGLFSRLTLNRATSNIVQTPYLQEHFHPKFLRKLMSGENVSYTNYGLNIAGTPDYHYQLQSYKEFSNLLVSSDRDIDGFQQAGVEGNRVTQIGNPLVFEIGNRRTPTFLDKAPSQGMRVLWAPHWDANWSNWESTLPIFNKILHEISEISLTFRPHPGLLAGLQGRLPEGYRFSHGKKSESLEQLQAFLRHDRVALSVSSLEIDCHQNDFLVTDGVSIIGFWASTGKPMAVLRRPDSPPFSPQISDLRNQLDFIEPVPSALVGWVISKCKNLRKAQDSRQEFTSPFLVYENGKPIDPTSLLLGVFQ